MIWKIQLRGKKITEIASSLKKLIAMTQGNASPLLRGRGTKEEAILQNSNKRHCEGFSPEAISTKVEY